jgi:ribosome-binding protein aMBF1 (putative translation factor)
MKEAKRKKLEAAGFRIGDAEDFLELTPEERELVGLRIRLSRMVRVLRERKHLTQQQLAARIQSSQSRIAKLESGASDISLDLMFRGFFAVGGKLSAVGGQVKRRSEAKRRSRSV